MPLQQPLAQDDGSQTQLPAWQYWPTAQAGSPPHWQSPSSEQLSASVGLQAKHASPLAPQLASAGAKQVRPEQQPSAHTVASQPQAPEMQRWLASQISQARPAVPQASSSDPGRQVVPSQQPVAQDCPSQTQAPPMQR